MDFCPLLCRLSYWLVCKENMSNVFWNICPLGHNWRDRAGNSCIWLTPVGLPSPIFQKMNSQRFQPQACLVLKWKVLLSQVCPTLWDPMDCCPPDSSVHGLLQARILEGVAPYSRGNFPPGDRTHVSCIAGGFFTIWATREALITREASKLYWQIPIKYYLIPFSKEPVYQCLLFWGLQL